MFTVQDVIHLIQYYYHTSSWEGAAADVEQIRLQSIRSELTSQRTVIARQLSADIEKTLSVPPPPLLSVHPLRPLFDACRFLIRTHARRLPLIDKDTQTNGEVVISVLTQYRVLKFIAVNVRISMPVSVRALTSVPGHHAIPYQKRARARHRHIRRRSQRGPVEPLPPHRDSQPRHNGVRRRAHVLRAGYLGRAGLGRGRQGAEPVRDCRRYRE